MTESLLLTLVYLAVVLIPLSFVAGLVVIMFTARAARAVARCTCGYDLTHLPPLEESPNCPECGMKRGHITVRHPHGLTIGLVLVIAPVVVTLALLAWGVAMMAG